MLPITFVTGPPGAGKTTFARALAERHPFGLHLPVDDLRLWVTSGLSDSVPWTEETEHQFQIAEDAAVAVARRYQEADFAVVIDHCRNLLRLDRLIQDRLSDRPVRRVLLLPNLDVNLQRNRERTNKDFDPAILDDTIRFTNDVFRTADAKNWIVIDNTERSVEQCLDILKP